VVLYGLVNVALYSSLLPLWEGFDEPFHYAYVQHVAEHHSLPVWGITPLSGEIWTSLHIAPGSSVVKNNLPWITTFDEYFRLPLADRVRIRGLLTGLHRGATGAGGANYEAHQAPLAYLLSAVADDAFSSLNLLTRVWLLRLLCGIAAIALTSAALLSLAARLRIPDRSRMSLLFVVFSWQMLYASTAHICNDWLAVPLMVLLVERSVALQESPTTLNQAAAVAALVAGLLTKAYFLALIPLVGAVLIRMAVTGRVPWRRTGALFAAIIAFCAPWYLRNLELYRNLSGMQEANRVHAWRSALGTMGRVPWLRSMRQLAFASVWTGNNSFTSFSVVTISLLIAGLTIASGAYAHGLLRRRGDVPAGEKVVLAGAALYCSALTYSTMLTYWSTNGHGVSTSPWYTQPMIPIMLTLSFAGLAGLGTIGTAVRTWLIWLSAYIMVATYWAKLLPLYGGFPGDRTTLPALMNWYSNGTASIEANLSALAMVSPRWIFMLLLAQAVSAMGLALALSLGKTRHRESITTAAGAHAGKI
jgi:hypothetical protein